MLLCDIHVEKCQIIAENLAKELRTNSVLSVKCDVTKEDEFESKNVFNYDNHNIFP